VDGNVAEVRGLTLFQGNGDVAGHDVGAAQLENRDGGVLLHVSDADDGQLEIGLAGIMDRRLLPVERFPAIAIGDVADDLVALPSVDAAAVNENSIGRAGVSRLVRTVVASGDKQLVGDTMRRDVPVAIHVVRGGHIADVEVAGTSPRWRGRSRRLWLLRCAEP